MRDRLMLPLTLIEPPGGRARRSCASALTATTSRSAAAAPSCASSRSSRTLASTGSCSARTTCGRPRPSAAAEHFLAGGRQAGHPHRALPGELLPLGRRRDQGLLRGAQGRRGSRPDPHPPPPRPAPGPSPGRRAHVEHVARPPDPRVRDPEVRRRPRLAERLRRPRRSHRPAQGRRHPRPLPEPAAPGVVRRRHVPLGAAAAGHGGQRRRAASPRASTVQRWCSSDEGAGHGPSRLHRLGHGPAARSRRVTRWWGSTPASTRRAASGTAGKEVASVRLDLRDVEPRHLEGFEAVVHLAALSNDPLGDLDPQLTYDINHGASVRLARAAREAGVERFLFASSCSLYGASGTDAPAHRGGAVQSGDALRRVEDPRRAGRLDAGDRRLQPGLLPQRHRLRGLAVPAGRHHGQQPRRLRGHDRRGADQERRIALAPARPRRGHLPGLPGRPRAPTASAPTTRPSTSGSARRTSGSARWRTWSSRSSPAAGSSTPAGASADARDYRVDFGEDPTGPARVPAAVDGPQGRRGALRGLPAVRPDRGRVPRRPLRAAGRDQAPPGPGRLDERAALDRVRTVASTAVQIRPSSAGQRLDLRVGELVEVRSEEEILATLDDNGELDALPFMPEMLQYCGRQFTVYKVAHKLCDTMSRSGHAEDARRRAPRRRALRRAGARRLPDRLPHLLEGGLAPEAGADRRRESARGHAGLGAARLTAADLYSRSRKPGVPNGEELFSCQATELLRAAPELLPFRELGQYVARRPLGQCGHRRGPARLPRRAVQPLPAPQQPGPAPAAVVPRGPAVGVHQGNVDEDADGAAPTCSRASSCGSSRRREIMATLSKDLRNRGLGFEEEMARHCGREARVLRRVDRCIEEGTGRLLRDEEPLHRARGHDLRGRIHRQLPALDLRVLEGDLAREGRGGGRARAQGNRNVGADPTA